MRKFAKKVMGKLNVITAMNALALLLAIDTVNSACIWILYQPDVPKEMQKYKKQ